ncbi:tetratricopeptide repeat protein [Arthrobacter sp. Rue61a]|uniref:tetratricopeptide repeat protein n=1 Tax=Arthrobacter sp. Rue61a TaxID=1118963 RepID=UPI00027DFBF5|nr:tetratricopeptide repeat protein [Arthrobacter sp. Rue61a]AFR28658.1 nephrocystin [Arthrobacter sp. Rue61a]
MSESESRRLPGTIVNISGGTVGAIGDHNQVMMPRRTLVWPVVVGAVPTRASAYQPREAVIEQISMASGAIVLQQLSGQVLAGAGGVGKTQIAVGIFTSSSADIRLWINAESREAIVAGFAEAAIRLDLADTSLDSEQLSRIFIGFLGSTDRRWLIVLDDVRAVSDLDGLWPPVSGSVIVTTRRRDASFSGSGRTIIPVNVFTTAEAEEYLRERISPHRDDLPKDVFIEVPQLVQDLGRLPLALAQAAAVIIDQGITCAVYRAMFADRATALEELFPPEASADGYSRTVATTWELAVLAADEIEPCGLALPMANLVSTLDPAGVPEAALTGQAVCSYLSQISEKEVTADKARRALRALHRLSLIDHNPKLGNPRAVRMHNLTGLSIRHTISADGIAALGFVAASALITLWPETEQDPLLIDSLRSNTVSLIGSAQEGLWDKTGYGSHPVLSRYGVSLINGGLTKPAIEYHHRMLDDSINYLGPEHVDTLSSRNNLASAYKSAGNLNEAIALYEQTLHDRLRILGEDHPDVLTSRNNLATAYVSLGKMDRAVSLLERTLADRERVLGKDHPDVLGSRSNLAGAYQAMGKVARAIPLFERTAADRERVSGPDHPDTLGARNNLAGIYMEIGKFSQAIPLFEQTLTDQERVSGPDHPDTLGARNNLAGVYQAVGETEKSIALFERSLEDHLRIVGPDHPNTMSVRNNLAGVLHQAGYVMRAASLYKQTLADRTRILGQDHPQTLTSLNNLASIYTSVGKLELGIKLYKQAMAGRERVLGPEHPSVLASRNNVAATYMSMGKIDQAIELYEGTLARQEALLGGAHPHTKVTRTNLSSAREFKQTTRSFLNREGY